MKCVKEKSRTPSRTRVFFSESVGGKRGTAAIELALITPFYALMLVGAFDFTMATYRNLQVQASAQAGAEYAMSHGYTTGISNMVTEAAPYSGVSASPSPVEFCGCASSVGVTSVTCNSSCSTGETAGTYVTVSAQANYTTVLPYPLAPSSYTFSAESTVRIQ